MRDALVRTRTRYVALIKAAVRREGLRLPSGEAEHTALGYVAALGCVAALDDVTRFTSAHQVEAYLGLVPSEHSSGERQHRGRITKRGNPRVRWLLVEAGWRILRSRDPAAAALRAWGERIAVRRGKRIAAVALARRLAGILFAMWRDQTAYRQTREVRSAA